MGAASAGRAKSANSRGVKSGPSKGQKWPEKVHRILPFELFLRQIWPQDRTKKYMHLTACAERTAKRRLSGADPDYAEVVAMLRSEHGFEFLEHVMGDASPKWWKGVRKARGLGDMRRQLAEQQRRIAQLEMALD